VDLFRDMLSDSIASTSLVNPLPVDEDSEDFEILLLDIDGRGEEALRRGEMMGSSRDPLSDVERIPGRHSTVLVLSNLCTMRRAEALGCPLSGLQ
jgi:hypothetical protein